MAKANKVDRLEELRQMAEKFFLQQGESESNFLQRNYDDLINELSIYQNELKKQNETLTHKQTELTNLQKKYQCLYHFAPAAFLTLDAKGLILEVNNAAANLLGIKSEFLVNQSFCRYIAPESQTIFSTFRKNAAKPKHPAACEIKLLRRNKSIKFIHLEATTIQNANNKQAELLVCLTEIINPKTKANKNAELTHIEFSSMLLSELNQPLAIITNYLNGCIHRLINKNYKSDDLLYALKQAIKQNKRISEIILRMKNLDYKKNLQKELVCIDTLMQDTIDLIPYELANLAVKITARISPNLPKIFVDKIYIQQAILSLVRNCIEAMRDANSSAPEIIINVHAGEKNMIEIEVIDNGPGMDKETVEKLFTPHFTTKNYGIGLGLLVCRSIIENHGGQLTIAPGLTTGVSANFTLQIN